MEMLEPCKVVVFGGIKEFRLHLKKLNVSEIQNDNDSIKESDVVLIHIEIIDGKFIAKIISDLSTFNDIDARMVSSWEIKDIVYIRNLQQIKDFNFDTNKIYYVKSFDSEADEFWLFRPREKKQEFLTSHTSCISICRGKMDYDNWKEGTIMDNDEITELREATQKEIGIYNDAYDQQKHRFD